MPITDLVIAADGSATCKVTESEGFFGQLWDGLAASLSKTKTPTSHESTLALIVSNTINHFGSVYFGHAQAAKGKPWYLHKIIKTPVPVSMRAVPGPR